ncbi:MAG: leucine-rich repeat protein [Clostridia bacterium]|nr:leucine-rich repeat protein [Clostridia bacterium]
MKKRIALVCLLCFLLCGCIATSPQEGAEDTPTVSTSPAAQITADAAKARLEYYEALVEQLQQELLTMKTQIYQTTVEYEALLEELRGMGQGREETEEAFSYTVVNGEATLTAYLGSASEVVVPTHLGGAPVVAVADRAFENHAQLASVSLPEGVREIGWFAFSGCVALTRIDLPASVSDISYGAFEHCHAALTVYCPVNSYAQRYAQSYGLRAVGT